MVVFDPLDRDVCNEEGEVQNIKSCDLKRKIEHELVPVEACLLQHIMSDEQNRTLMNMFDRI